MSERNKDRQRAPIHLLMRFSDRLGFIRDTIEAHSEVIKKSGAAWFGKMGKTLGRDKVQRINDQRKRKTPTFLYLVQRSADGYQIYRGDILQVARDLEVGQARFIPKYYRTHRLEEYIHLWTKVSRIKAVPSLEITRYVVASSGSPALVALRSSMAAMFVIRAKDGGDDVPRSESEAHEDDWDI